VTPRRVLFPVLAALLLVCGASPARAVAGAFHRHAPAPIRSITLTPEGSGTLIRITYAGRLRNHTRTIRSREAIDALAVVDVDNDGRLDIVAAAHTGALRLWRNAGRGRYELARPLAAGDRTPVTRRVRVGRALLADEPVQAGDERYDAAMPRAPAPASDPCLFSTPPARERTFGAIVPSFSPGRAPPSRA
jgi:hypothetical protein